MSETLPQGENEDWKKWLQELRTLEETDGNTHSITEKDQKQHVELDLELLPTTPLQKCLFGRHLTELTDHSIVISTAFGSLSGLLVKAETNYLVLAESTDTRVFVPYQSIEWISEN